MEPQAIVDAIRWFVALVAVAAVASIVLTVLISMVIGGAAGYLVSRLIARIEAPSRPLGTGPL